MKPPARLAVAGDPKSEKQASTWKIAYILGLGFRVRIQGLGFRV